VNRIQDLISLFSFLFQSTETILLLMIIGLDYLSHWVLIWYSLESPECMFGAGPSRATAGPGNHNRGSLWQPHSVCAKIEREETWARGVSWVPGDIGHKGKERAPLQPIPVLQLGLYLFDDITLIDVLVLEPELPRTKKTTYNYLLTIFLIDIKEVHNW